MLPPVAVIVPWRDKGDPARRRNQAYVVDRLRGLGVGTVHVVGDGRHGDAPFNRSAAYNRGIRQAPDARIYVFHEADMILTRMRLVNAIRLAATPGLVIPFDTYWYLSQFDSERVVRHHVPPQGIVPQHEMRNGAAVGAVCVASAASMQLVGQWDEQFTGWGYDDRAMAKAFQICTHTPTRYVPGHGLHLWHTPGWQQGTGFRGGAEKVAGAEKRATEANKARWMRYKSARSPQQIRALTAGG